jgi:hypothetical protein
MPGKLWRAPAKSLRIELVLHRICFSWLKSSFTTFMMQSRIISNCTQ